jgi:zinc D-Ala-D-Ala dipeptidase
MSAKFAGVLAGCLVLSASAAFAQQLPPGFVYLADVAPTIRQDIRYAGSHNFVGRPIKGYTANECVLSELAARALARVQDELAEKGLSLIVWDCYRPARAVADFLAWSKVPGDARMKAEFYPNTDKARFFALGYLSSRSAHSRGSTVDLGIVPKDGVQPSTYDPTAALEPCTAPKGRRFDDGTIDLGTGYDCLDPQASTTSQTISENAMANRNLLQNVMQRAGFKPYSREWWHFELADEPFPQQTFDFPVVARGASQPLKAASFGSYWTSFKNAVLKRDAASVASATSFPFPRASKELDEATFVADFEAVFNGAVTACVALGSPEANSKAATDSYVVRCGHEKNPSSLTFRMVDGTWHLVSISTRTD